MKKTVHFINGCVWANGAPQQADTFQTEDWSKVTCKHCKNNAWRVVRFRSCDNCGEPVKDEDEVLCRKCKPSLQLKADLRDAWDRIDAAYWRFCRSERAKPPSMAEPEAHAFLRKHGIVYNKDVRP